jgi:hypothetical protein
MYIRLAVKAATAANTMSPLRDVIATHTSTLLYHRENLHKASVNSMSTTSQSVLLDVGPLIGVVHRFRNVGHDELHHKHKPRLALCNGYACAPVVPPSLFHLTLVHTLVSSLSIRQNFPHRCRHVQRRYTLVSPRRKGGPPPQHAFSCLDPHCQLEGQKTTIGT